MKDWKNLLRQENRYGLKRRKSLWMMEEREEKRVGKTELAWFRLREVKPHK